MDAYQALARRYPQLQIQFNEREGTFTATAAPVPGSLNPDQSRPQTLLLTDPRLTPEDRRLIIEARLAAMARVGIAEGDRRILRTDEARALLGLPASLTGMDSTRYTQLLREAADRATTLFGPRYARLAFTTALGFRTGLSPDQREAGQSAAGLLPGGNQDALTPADLSRLASMSRLSQEEALWRYGTPGRVAPGTGEFGVGSVMGLPGAPPVPPPGSGGPLAPFSSPSPFGPGAFGSIMGQGQPNPLGDPSGRASGMPGTMPSVPGVSVAPTGSPGQFGRPTQEDIGALLEAPLRRQEAFDRRFGPGSAAMYLRQAQEGGVSVGRPIRRGQ
jgi:hypothetical protein